MKTREFYQAVIDANISEELNAFAAAGIEKLDHALSLRKDSAAKKALE